MLTNRAIKSIIVYFIIIEYYIKVFVSCEHTDIHKNKLNTSQCLLGVFIINNDYFENSQGKHHGHVDYTRATYIYT